MHIFSSPSTDEHLKVVSKFLKINMNNLPARDPVQSLGQEDLEKGMDTHFSFLSWETPWTEEPGKLQFMGSQRVGHD